MSWTEAINSLVQRRIGGEPIAEALLARAAEWLEARQKVIADPRPTSVFPDNEGGLIIDFRVERELQFAAEFHADGTAELQTWDKGTLVKEEAIRLP